MTAICNIGGRAEGRTVFRMRNFPTTLELDRRRFQREKSIGVCCAILPCHVEKLRFAEYAAGQLKP
jgi:hypothetical protein